MAKTKKDLPAQAVRASRETERVNKYYLKVSDRYRVAKYVTILILAAFIAVTMIVWRDEITYSNLMYLLRDFNTGEEEYSGGFDPIKYDEQENMTYAIFREELAVAGNRTLKMYNTKGTESRKYELGYTDPVLVSSNKYLLAFDLGKTSYSVFTSVAKTHSGEGDGTIEDAAMNDSGSYALLYRSSETKYVISTYDPSFRETAKYYKNKYVTSIDIGEGGEVLILSVTPGMSDIVLEAELYKKGEDTPSSTYTREGVFPVDSGIAENGAFYVICTDRVIFFGSDGEFVAEHELGGGYTSFAAENDKILLSASVDTLGAKSSVFLFDMAGELLYNGRVDGNVTSVALSENEIFALSADAVTIIPYEDGDPVSVPIRPGGTVLLSAGDGAVLCSETGAESIRLDLNSSGDGEENLNNE